MGGQNRRTDPKKRLFLYLLEGKKNSRITKIQNRQQSDYRRRNHQIQGSHLHLA